MPVPLQSETLGLDLRSLGLGSMLCLGSGLGLNLKVVLGLEWY